MPTRSHPPVSDTAPQDDAAFPETGAVQDLAIELEDLTDTPGPSPEELAALVGQTRPRKDEEVVLRSGARRSRRAKAAEAQAEAPAEPQGEDTALNAQAALQRAQSISARVAATPRSSARRVEDAPAPSAATSPEPDRESVKDDVVSARIETIEAAVMHERPDTTPLVLRSPDTTPAAEAPMPSPETARFPASSGRQEPASVHAAQAPTQALSLLPTSQSNKGQWLWTTASVAAVSWPAGIGAYLLGTETATASLLASLPMKLVMYGVMGLLPAGLVLALAAALRQSQRLAEENQRAFTLAESMVAPAALASTESVRLVQQIHEEINSAVRAADQARAELSALREAIKLETERLHDTTVTTRNASGALVQSLRAEREAMIALGQDLDRQSGHILDSVERQARMVADAAGLASEQLREAEDSLAARTAELAAAAAETTEATRLAGEDLTRQSVRLESAGESVSNQVRTLEQTLSSQRASLVSSSHALRKDQQEFAETLSAQQTQLVDSLAHARLAASELSDASANGAEVLRDLMRSALDQVSELMSMGERERDEISARAEQSLTHFSDVVAQTRETLTEETSRAVRELTAASDEARRAADIAAASAQARADQLAEAIFSAGRHADDSFNSRLREAERLVQEANGLVETAGSRAVEKLEVTRAQIRLTIEEMEGRLGAVPQIIREQMMSLTQHVEDSINALVSKASAAQARSGAPAAPAYVPRASEPRTLEPRAPEARTPEARPSELRPAPSSDRFPSERHTQDRSNPGARLSERDFERERDRSLTERPVRERLARPSEKPPQTEAYDPEEVRALFAAARPQNSDTAPAADLSWDDLLSDGPSAPPPPAAQTRPQPSAPAHATSSGAAHQPQGLEAMLLNELDRLGIDPSGLLPRIRVEEAARAIADGDDDGARQLIRRVAPAAVRRLSRAVLSDSELRDPSDRYVKLFETLLTDALRKPDPASALMQILPTEGGRLFLLLDAAIGDLG